MGLQVYNPKGFEHPKGEFSPSLGNVETWDAKGYLPITQEKCQQPQSLVK